MFEPFQKFIAKSVNRHGLGREFQAAEICHYFRTLMPKIFETYPDIKDFISPAHFKNNTLTINVKNPAWGQEVIMRQEKIINEMNAHAGQEIIKKLKTKITNN